MQKMFCRRSKAQYEQVREQHNYNSITPKTKSNTLKTIMCAFSMSVHAGSDEPLISEDVEVSIRACGDAKTEPIVQQQNT